MKNLSFALRASFMVICTACVIVVIDVKINDNNDN